jgi:tRNA(Arg) A34 adenosine deaminase TadA
VTITGLSRRQALFGAGCWLCGARAIRAATAASGPSCTDATAAPTIELTPAEEEAHGFFVRLAMALVYDGWSVDQSRPELQAAYAAIEPDRRFPDYTGHHVGGLLVDRNSNVASFALNRNVALNSTLEHAEVRTIRNAIRIANDQAGDARKPWSYADLLRGDRLYATLEPCAQCAGVMDLANIGATIYGQDDPGQSHIVNVLYNLQHRSGFTGAPVPIAATFTPYWNRLADAYRRFEAGSSASANTGVTSFLSTVEAYVIYRDTARDFDTLATMHPENVEVFGRARTFRERWRQRISEGVVPS